MVTYIRSIILITLVAVICIHANGQDPNEFHYGYAGFSITTGGPPSRVEPLVVRLDEYGVWGSTFIWESGSYRLRVSVGAVNRGTSLDAKSDRKLVVSKWKDALVAGLDKTLRVEDSPYIYNDFPGIEIRAANNFVARVFFEKTLLIAITFETRPGGDTTAYKPILDSFRPLTKTERLIAMIDEYTPPFLAQKRPPNVLWTDEAEIGLKGAVRLIRDTTPTGARGDVVVIQEQHFDVDGFLKIEIGFNNGFPDVITGWGWDKGRRVNAQSPVNFPPEEGPRGGRTTVVSGYIGGGEQSAPNASIKFGNRFEVTLDDDHRILEKRRFSNTGSLVLVEHYKYTGNFREKRTTDASGGFMGGIRDRLDANNNVLETQMLAGDGSVVNTALFEYRFDARGNWVERRAFAKSRGNKRATKKPFETYYREIRYFDNEDLRGVG